MTTLRKALFIQTAFLGDLILTLPLIQVFKRLHPDLTVDVVCRADAASILANHPAINRIYPYDKRGKDSGLPGFTRLSRSIAREHYDLAIIPHRSIRSAALAWVAGIPIRIGFDRSDGRWLLTKIVKYLPRLHEYRRNLDLLNGLNENWSEVEYPKLYPSAADSAEITSLITRSIGERKPLIAIAPGTLWNTKRWLPERFAAVGRRLCAMGYGVVLIGGPGDAALCREIADAGGEGVVSTAGFCSPLQSAELIRRSTVLLTNDSAPLHMGVAMGTPVAAIFGATTPSIGFAPYGPKDIVIENTELDCRPCAIHGGNTCPIQTFVCMKSLTDDYVLSQLVTMIQAGLVT